MDEVTRGTIADLLSRNSPEPWFQAQQSHSKFIQYPLVLRDVYPDGVVPRQPQGGWEGFHFNGSVIFDGLIFPDGFTFKNAHFLGGASFVGTRFLGAVTFEGAAFSRDILFDGTDFGGSVGFSGANLARGGTSLTLKNLKRVPSIDLSHTSSTAQTSLAIEDATVGEFFFISANHNAILRMTDVRVTGSADFEKAMFLRGAFITRCTFEKGALFKNTGLLRNATFDGTTFEGPAVFNIDPTTLDPQRSNAVEMHTTSFVNARFGDRARFERRKFVGQVAFTGAHFDVAPEFFDAQFTDEVDFEHAMYGPITKGNAAEAERRYRALKLKVSEKQSHRQELIFFAQEMAAKRWTEPNAGIAFLHACYGAVSGFGQSVGRPLVGLVGVFVAFAAIYALGIDGNTMAACVGDANGCFIAWDRIRGFFALSLAGLAPFLDAGKLQAAALAIVKAPTALWLQVALWLEALISLLFLFLIGLGLRNVFRLK